MVSARANYDERIDVYAFGILLSEMLTWRLAYTDLGYENVFVFRDSVTQHGVRPTLDIDERDPICKELGALFAPDILSPNACLTHALLLPVCHASVSG